MTDQPLIWLSQDKTIPLRLTEAFNLLASAEDNGLNEQNYQLTLLQNLWQDLQRMPDAPFDRWLLLDTAISFNLIHFLSDIYWGQINPYRLNIDFPRQLKQQNIPAILFDAIQNNNITRLVRQIEPQIPDYRYLKEALLDYRQKITKTCPVQINIPHTIHFQQITSKLWSIRQRLSELGFQSYQKSPGIYYDNELLTQIIDFQIHHGLEPDGIIGKKTIAALNISQTKRIEQIELALERFRWLPDMPQPSALVMINIPTFQLWTYQIDNHQYQRVFNMRVIVGQAKDWQSPIFSAKILYLEFAPYWNIPDSILKKEILPKIQEDTGYLKQQNMELVSRFHHNDSIVPFSEDVIALLQEGVLKVRQRPGQNNALGKVKFMFPNRYNVYLHDTPGKRAFNQSKRDLSHGCIRVENPVKLADFLLQANPQWNRQKILDSMKSSQPQHVTLKFPIPVIIFYSTTLATEQGIFFYHDIYRFDQPLIQALSRYSKELIASRPEPSAITHYTQINNQDLEKLIFN